MARAACLLDGSNCVVMIAVELMIIRRKKSFRGRRGVLVDDFDNFDCGGTCIVSTLFDMYFCACSVAVVVAGG